MRGLFLISTGDSLATSIQGYPGVLQPNNVGNSDEGLGKEANVLREIERGGGIISNFLDTVVGMEGAR